MTRQLILMGSGENSPVMVTPHQNAIKTLGKESKRVNLDTPYGFQENADELTARILGYFEKNVQFPAQDLHARDLSSSAAEEVAKADWVFSGPGSPTYALKVWQATGMREALLSVLERGVVVMASAAGMPLGSKVMPVYEMYKVGDDPHWLPGLNILEPATGINAAIVAHYNNTQGGTHDTRFCFIGEGRFRKLEEQLDGTAVLGIDEHTGISFDLDEQVAHIFGKGKVTLRRNGDEKVFETKTTVPIDQFRN